MQPDPQARSASIVRHGKARFTVLSDRMLRLEWAEDGRFEDRASLRVSNRRLSRVPFEVKTTGNELVLKTGHLTLRYRDTGRPFSAGNPSVEFDGLAGRKGRWRHGARDRRNLGGTFRTLDGAKGDRRFGYETSGAPEGDPIDLGQGFLSRSGWAVLDDTDGIVLEARRKRGRRWVAQREPGVRRDLYLLAHGLDYKGALADASRVFGPSPLPPRYALGTWYSHYWAYTDKEIEALVERFDRMGVPLDVFVIDMDWHLPGWTGYTWDERYFPDPEAHLAWLHEQGLHVTLNLHPASGIGPHEAAYPKMCKKLGLDPKRRENIDFDCTDPRFMAAYFEVLHNPLERAGVDFWWIDWQQGSESAIAGLDPLPWVNQLHWEDLARTRPGKRPLIFSRYGGVGAGRYPVGFSGDTHSSWESLAYQPGFTANAANVLYGAWSHDIGGHFGGRLDPELYTRWIQFGAFSPVLRTHASKMPDSLRKVWEYPSPFGDVMSEAIRLRYALAPYIYGELRRAEETGVSLLRPTYYEWPKEQAAYRCPSQYMFGDSMLVAPATAPRDQADEMAEVRVWLPKGPWFDVSHGCTVEGGGWRKRRYLLDEIPVFVRPGAVIPGQRDARRLGEGSYASPTFTLYPGEAGRGVLYEDDGITTRYRHGEAAEIELSHRATKKGRRIRLHPARGRFAGFAAKRPVDLLLPAVAPPDTVTLDGRPLPWRHRPGKRSAWSYRAETATLVIRIAKLDLRRGAQVRIHAAAGSSDRAADGMAGLVRRLERISALASMVSPPFTLHPDERMAVDAYQSANRIGRDPDRFSQETRRMRKLVSKLPRALAGFHDAYAEFFDPDGAKRAVLRRASAILATTRKQFR